MRNFVFLNTVPISLGKKGYSCTTLPASCIQVCVKGPVRKARKSIAWEKKIACPPLVITCSRELDCKCEYIFNFEIFAVITRQPNKKDGDRSKGKGRRVCLGGRIYSIPCRASCFDSVDFEEKVRFILFFILLQDSSCFVLLNLSTNRKTAGESHKRILSQVGLI